MALTEVQNGTQSATLDTEHDLGSQVTDDAYYQLRVDLSNMVNGDVTIIRWHSVVESGGAEALEGSGTYAHAQEAPRALSPPIPCIYGLQFTLEQTDGTGRSYDWSIMKSA